MTNKRYKDTTVRKQQIIDEGLALARRGGVDNVTRDAIAERVGVSGAAVQYHFNTVKQLRRAIKRAAVASPWSNLRTVARLIVADDPVVEGLSAEVKASALEMYV